MGNYWEIVNTVIHKADILLLVLDSRLVNETRNTEIENKVRSLEKPLIYVLNKCDLIGKDEAQRKANDLNPSVFVSSKEFLGTTKLRDRILIEGSKKGIKDKKIKVGVLGYPNVGKSSLINALRGKSVAKSSLCSGYTKGVQKIRMDNKIMLLDTPGVIPYNEKNATKHAFIGTVDFTKVKEPDMVVMDLMAKFPEKIESFYEVETREDPEEVIEAIAIKRNIMKRGAKPDVVRMARMILKDWQTGLIK